MRLEICLGCKAQRRTAHLKDGQLQLIASDPDPLPPFCAGHFHNLGHVYTPEVALGEQPSQRRPSDGPTQKKDNDPPDGPRTQVAGRPPAAGP